MVGLIESSHRLWGFISQTHGKQEVGIHENSWLSFVDATIVVIVLVRAHGSCAMNDYCILLGLCEGVKP
jgi:xanthine/uracil permease